MKTGSSVFKYEVGSTGDSWISSSLEKFWLENPSLMVAGVRKFFIRLIPPSADLGLLCSFRIILNVCGEDFSGT